MTTNDSGHPLPSGGEGPPAPGWAPPSGAAGPPPFDPYRTVGAPAPAAWGSPAAPAPSGPGGPVLQGWGAGPRDATGLGIATLVLGGVLVLGDLLQAATASSAAEAYEAAAARGEDPATVVTAFDLFAVLGLTVVPLWIVGSLWLARVRANAALLAPAEVRRSEIWCWLGWGMPFVSLWFPKTIVDDGWRITARALPGGGSARSRYRATWLWWVLWLLYMAPKNVVSRIEGGGKGGAEAVVPAVLHVVIAVLGVAAFAAWYRVVRGVSRAQAELSGTAR